MKIFIILFLILTLTNTLLIAQTNWEWQYSTTTEDLNDVHFVTAVYGTGSYDVLLDTPTAQTYIRVSIDSRDINAEIGVFMTPK